MVESLEHIAKELRKCVRCGACRAHCPAFLELGREPAAARGKIALTQHLLQQDIQLDGGTYDAMSKCLLCGNCVTNCPNDVPTDKIVMAAREALAEARGLTSFHKAVALVVRNSRLMKLGAAISAFLAPLIFRRIPATSGLRLRFPLPFVGNKRHIPAIARRPFLGRHPETIAGKPGQPRILYFVGCMTNFVYPDVGDAALSLFQSLGYTILIPQEQCCCGLPALSGGDLKTAYQLAKKNLMEIEAHQADYIVTSCATCGGALHKFYPEVIGERFPDLGDRCRAVAEKSTDALTLLAHLGFRYAGNTKEAGRTLSITYHDPCHARSRGILQEPRQLLRGVPDIRLIEMEGADKCCGLGGTFNVYHYETSLGINKGKTSSILNTGADAVVTACPGCMMQLSDGLKQQGSKTRVLHILQLLAGKHR